MVTKNKAVLGSDQAPSSAQSKVQVWAEGVAFCLLDAWGFLSLADSQAERDRWVRHGLTLDHRDHAAEALMQEGVAERDGDRLVRRRRPDERRWWPTTAFDLQLIEFPKRDGGVS